MQQSMTLLQRMQEAVLHGSRLQIEFDNMRREFESLRAQVTEVVRQKQDADDTIVNIRRQRDEAFGEAAEWRDRFNQSEPEREQLRKEVDELRYQIAGLQRGLSNAIGERDEANASGYQLQQEVHTLKAQLDQERQHFEGWKVQHDQTVRDLGNMKQDRDDHAARVSELEEQVNSFREKLDGVTKALGLPDPFAKPVGVEAQTEVETLKAEEVPVQADPTAGTFQSPRGDSGQENDPHFRPGQPRDERGYFQPYDQD